MRRSRYSHLAMCSLKEQAGLSDSTAIEVRPAQLQARSAAARRAVFNMARLGLSAALLLAGTATDAALAQSEPAHTVVFSQQGFPTIDSEPVPQATLMAALGVGTVFADVAELRAGNALHGAALLVMPYGSAVPAAAWPAIESYLHGGGNLLLLGGQPLRVPVLTNRAEEKTGGAAGSFQPEAPQDSYSRVLGFQHSYAAPLTGEPAHFHWRDGYGFLPRLEVRAKQVFVEEGRLNGLGYLDAADGTHLGAPVIVVDRGADQGGSRLGSRIVALPFTPQPGYWQSQDGTSLIRAAAEYAEAGPAKLELEAQYSTLRPGELPELTLHLRQAGAHPRSGVVAVQLLAGGKVLDTANVPIGGSAGDGAGDVPVPFRKPLPAGVYTVRAVWKPEGAGAAQEFAQTGLLVEDLQALETGPALGVHGDFLSLGGKPFLPVGTNYFTTEENGWDFSGPRNAAVWEQDFADMERHNVTFVRTGVWMSNAKFVEPSTGEANERFLRNVEAYLAAAHRHHIAVNFTFFAFSPRVGEPRRSPDNPGAPDTTPANPYLDPEAVHAEQGYVRSVVQRFRNVPSLSYDLINEPSFSNPRSIFHGNVPNGDPLEVSAWQKWLEQHYTTLPALAAAWRVTPESLGSWSGIPLPTTADLSLGRYGNADEVRAYDYNLFAQDSFAEWVRGMVATIHAAGSTQLVDVGQDEGGVTNRLLNQFYAAAGVSFTTNHTYWQDDALLWDSVAAKRPGMPNITGETGYQPAWNPDGTWRYDELTGSAIEERKWALGFAAGSSGAMQWDWAREVDFGMERSDGSAKLWEAMMADMGAFAKAAAPYATGLTLPQVALILPQSLQLSAYNTQALAAQQTAVRVLYGHNRVEAYAVGEYQTDTLGTPKLIVLPSPYGLSDKVWADIEARVRAGAVLLISGPFDGDPHMHTTDRAQQLGLQTTLAPLQQSYESLSYPGGVLPLEYRGSATTMLDRSIFPDGKTWAELPLGAGKVLLSAFPLELNSDLDSVAAVYAYALKTAGVRPTYQTDIKNSGILICPTTLPHARLYVLTSETDTAPVAWTDTASGKAFHGTLDAGRAALLLVNDRGDVAASYGWHAAP